MSNVVELNGPINTNSIQKLISDIKGVYDNTPITLIITSTGGDPNLIRIFEGFVNGYNIKLHTVGIDMVESSAVPIFMLGIKRTIMPNTFFMIHEPKTQFDNQYYSVSDLEFEVKRLKKLKDEYINYIFPKCKNITFDVFNEKISCGNWIIYEQEAKELGIIT